MKITRRQFAGGAAALSIAALARRAALANPLGLPLGIQLYSVRKQMIEDLDGALAGVREAGFTEVEAAALPKKPAKEIRAALDKAGLKCVSAHQSFAELTTGFDQTVAYDQELGVEFIICPSPAYRAGAAPRAAAGAVKGPAPLTLDDWHYNAEQFNTIGEKMSGSHIRFGYHNHTREFVMTEGKTPYLELLALTDPAKVTFELDCGWAAAGGSSPAQLMKDHPGRFSLLHVKDFKIAAGGSGDGHDAKVTELGMGSIDYRPVFMEAAKSQKVRHAFVEQEEFDMPWKESLKVDAEYMRKLR